MKACRKVQHLDYFADSISWRIQNGTSKFRTYTGALLTIAMGVVWLEFCLERLTNMLLKTQISVNSFRKLNVFDETNSYDNFTFAFGLSSFLVRDPVSDSDPDFGEIHVYLDRWNATS